MTGAGAGRASAPSEQRNQAPRDLPGRARAHPAAYSIVCTDLGEVRVVADGSASTLKSHTFVDDLPIATAFGDVVPRDCADLVDVAIAVYAADRLCRRHPRNAPCSEPLWQRRMHLEVPVREPERWNHGGLGDALSDLLNFLTDDDWALKFVARRPTAARFSEAQPGFFADPPSMPATAALFSGGLDSLAGLVTRLATNPMETVVVFSGRTNKRIGAPQRILLEALARAFPQRVRSIAVRFGFDRRARGAYDREENSQRTRGFVFQAFGAVTARMAGLDGLAVYENGVGAINLPYTGAQLGSQATRATHPVTVRLMSALLTQVFETPFSVELPYAFATKGELCDGLRSAGLGHLARHTVSCDGYPQRAKRAPQCGVCPSCLLRRQSLHHAGLLDDDPACLYMHDIYNAAATDAHERRFSLRAMDGQVHHLRQALAAAPPWDALVTRYPELEEAADALAGPNAGAAVREALLSLYGRYCTEWSAFAARTIRTGDGALDSGPAHQVAVRPQEPRRVSAGGPARGMQLSRARPEVWQDTAAGEPNDR